MGVDARLVVANQIYNKLAVNKALQKREIYRSASSVFYISLFFCETLFVSFDGGKSSELILIHIAGDFQDTAAWVWFFKYTLCPGFTNTCVCRFYENMSVANSK